jgi:hypothetical protein
VTTKSGTFTRRTLIRNGAAAGLAAALGTRPWSAAAAAASAGHLRRSSYSGLVGQSFGVDSIELRLVSVSDVAGAKSSKSLAGSEDAFVLTFSGPRSAPLEGRTHRFRHPRLGTFELFVSPVGLPRDDRRYEAVIDRSVAAR